MSNTPDQRPPATLLITDLDNTLWDWFEAWYESFSAMLTKLSELSGVPAAVLEPEIRKVHQARGTSEYSHLLNELPSLIGPAGDQDPLIAFDAAMHAQNSARKRATRLYPRVLETLQRLRGQGVSIAAYTESVAYWTEWRIKHTGLDGVIDVLYSAPDHGLPDDVTLDDIRQQPEESYGLKLTRHEHVPRGSVKPNAGILRSILADFDRTPEGAVYVGDSLMKDIAMAQTAGVTDAFAEYGLVQARPEYALLRRVSHWPDDDVKREETLATSREVTPTHTLQHDLSEVLPLFGIGEV